MKFHYYNLETCHQATGFVVVIDVIRAFTNAAVAFSRGAKEIHPVGTVEEVLNFKRLNPNSLACGEVGGIPPEGFDFGNSPTFTDALDLRGRTIVQRTGAGTQGIVRCLQASQMVAASFVVAGATVAYIRSIHPDEVSFVVTGFSYDGGEEDRACAEYLESLLLNSSTDPTVFLDRVRDSHDGRQFLQAAMPHAPITDLDYCTSLDRYDFAMPVTRGNGGYVIRPVRLVG